MDKKRAYVECKKGCVDIIVLAPSDDIQVITLTSRGKIISELLNFDIIYARRDYLANKLSPPPDVVGPMDEHLPALFKKIIHCEVPLLPVNSGDPNFDFMAEQYQLGVSISSIAVAGAGKTTALLKLHELTPNKNTIVLTYNKQLQLKISKTIEEKFPDRRMIAYTFHGLAGKFYGDVISDDALFERYSGVSISPIMNIDVLMIDEAQDLNELYFEFVNKVSRIYPDLQIVMVGDPKQTIGTDRSCTAKYLLSPSEHFGMYFIKCNLNKSYRLTPSLAAFVNTHIFGHDAIVGANKGEDIKPLYYPVKGVSEMKKALKDILNIMSIKNVDPEDILVLMPSTTRSSDYSLISDFSSMTFGIPYTIVNSYFGPPDDTAGKMLVMNFHACKGCERPIVIVLGIDEEYFKYYASNFRSTEQEPIPNVLNVALTRASKKLIIISSQNSLRTIIPSKLKDHVMMGSELEVIDNTGIVKEACSTTRADEYQKHFTVTTTEYTDMLTHQRFMFNIGTTSRIPLYLYELMIFIILNDRYYRHTTIDSSTPERIFDDVLDSAIKLYKEQSGNKHKQFDVNSDDVDVELIAPVIEAIREFLREHIHDTIARPIIVKLADNIDTNGYKKLAKLYGEDFSLMLYGQRKFYRVLINN